MSQIALFSSMIARTLSKFTPVGGAEETTGAAEPNDSVENVSVRPDTTTVTCAAAAGFDGPASGTKAVRIAASTKRVETEVSATLPPVSPKINLAQRTVLEH